MTETEDEARAASIRQNMAYVVACGTVVLRLHGKDVNRLWLYDPDGSENWFGSEPHSLDLLCIGEGLQVIVAENWAAEAARDIAAALLADRELQQARVYAIYAEAIRRA